MTDFRSEQENNTEELGSRCRIAMAALENAEDKIAGSTLEISEEELINLACNYIAYQIESVVHAQDMAFLMRENLGVLPNQEIPVLTSARGEAEVALFDAHHSGDYKKVKEFLKKHVSEDFLEAESVKYGYALRDNLLKLAQKIPDSGPSYKLPMPAWKDPRFNLETFDSETS